MYAWSQSVPQQYCAHVILQLTSLKSVLFSFTPITTRMPRMDMSTRRRVNALRYSDYSVAEIRKRLSKENMLVSSQALFNLIRKHRQTGKLLDLTRGPRPRKLTQVIVNKLNKALSDNDELTAIQARNFLAEKWPGPRVSLPTIKHIRKELGWVCTKPHYCKLLRDVNFTDKRMHICDIINHFS